jgi:hypothetical protein
MMEYSKLQLCAEDLTSSIGSTSRLEVDLSDPEDSSSTRLAISSVVRVLGRVSPSTNCGEDHLLGSQPVQFALQPELLLDIDLFKTQSFNHALDGIVPVLVGRL